MTTVLGWVLVTIMSTGEPMLQRDETTGGTLYKSLSACQQDAVRTYSHGVQARCLEVRGER